MTREDDLQLEELSDEECLRYLACQVVGRVAVASRGEAPNVVPVNFRLDGRSVVFRTDAGDKLSLLHLEPASFQVDNVDPAHHTGWSVLVQGTAYEASHDEVAHLVLQPWAPGDKRHWLRLVPAKITGRRLRFPQMPDDPLGQRAYL